MRIKLLVVGAVLALLATLFFWHQSSAKPDAALRGGAPATSELVELQAEVLALKRRLARNEEVAAALATRVESDAPAASGTPRAARRPDDGEEPVAASPPSRPTLEQQIARFEKHFANLDALRGGQRDTALEAKFRELLSNDAARKLSTLDKLKIVDISCGNRFCKLELDFEDHVLVRMGQTEIQIQLAPISSGASIYVDPETSRLHAYFATGGERLPEFPTMEEVALGGG